LSELVTTMIVVTIAGAAGGLANLFIGDSGLHLPKIEDGVFMPGWIGTVVVGALAGLGSWCVAKSIVIYGGPTVLTFSTGDIGNALLMGFGGAKWFKSEIEKDILQTTAAIAAGKPGNANAAAAIAGAAPGEALRIAKAM
jgi:hypothetical protein